MSESIRAALTAEEWKEREDATFDFWCEDSERPFWGNYAGHRMTDKDRQWVAAFALHDQPFGFTHEDVELLRRYARIASAIVNEPDWRETEKAAGLLADRIAALLAEKK